MFVSEIKSVAPDSFQTALQRSVYETLNALDIPYERVETDKAVTMEDCREINQKLHMDMVKTLFLCNRQQTCFYLFITPGGKIFKAKEFCKTLNIPRVSFAPESIMKRKLGVTIGAATIFSVLLDSENTIQVVMDNDVLLDEWYGCSDGTVTGYMKVKTKYILNIFLPHAKHTPVIVTV
jgi:Ala-tRNA(Pro) deacylase